MINFLEHLWPHPQQIAIRGEIPPPTQIRIQGEVEGVINARLAQDLQAIAGLQLSKDQKAYPLVLKLDASLARRESYRLTMNQKGASIAGADEPGLAYGIQTLLQVLALSRKKRHWPELSIHDWPAYKKRGFMADMGRSIFTLPLLKRLIRILARLKMNQLHLHLYDDELCGLCFEGLPFGQENPYALTLADLAEIVRYAARYHIEIVPELEGWGHVGSLVYHRPQLRGGAGMFAGSSFLVGQESFALMKELTRQVTGAMPPQATVHFGLDEALWFPAPSMPQDFTPADLVRRYYELLQEIGAESGQDLTMRIWADLVGEQIAQDIQRNTIVEPWQYWKASTDQIEQAIETYSGPGKTRWMMGGGQSVHQYRGAYHATRHWCRRALESPNVEGVNITFWGSNDLDGRFLSLFAGAYFAWNPRAETSFAGMEDYERFDRQVYPIMYAWQSAFRDAFADDIRRDRGPLVLWGHYLWGPEHGRPVAPTAAAAAPGTFPEHEHWRRRV